MIKGKVVALFLLACAVYCLFRAAAPAAAQEPAGEAGENAGRYAVVKKSDLAFSDPLLPWRAA